MYKALALSLALHLTLLVAVLLAHAFHGTLHSPDLSAPAERLLTPVYQRVALLEKSRSILPRHTAKQAPAAVANDAQHDDGHALEGQAADNFWEESNWGGNGRPPSVPTPSPSPAKQNVTPAALPPVDRPEGVPALEVPPTKKKKNSRHRMRAIAGLAAGYTDHSSHSDYSKRSSKDFAPSKAKAAAKAATLDELIEQRLSAGGVDCLQWYGGIGVESTQSGQRTVITQVYAGLPAERAGIRPGDVLLSDVEDLRGAPGSEITLWIKRFTSNAVRKMPLIVVREKICLEDSAADTGNFTGTATPHGQPKEKTDRTWER